MIDSLGILAMDVPSGRLKLLTGSVGDLLVGLARSAVAELLLGGVEG